jgi:apolipoprotein N-acyltransferase
VWGIYGLGFALVAAAGALVELVGRARRTSSPGAPGVPGAPDGSDAQAPLARRLLRAAPGLCLPLAALVLARVVSAPASEPGPRLLLVQPNVEQRRKLTLPRPEDLFFESLELTRTGLAEARAAGGGPIDLVAWGETMLPFPLIEEGLEAAHAAGARSPAWTRDDLTPGLLRWSREREREWVGRELFGGPLQPGVLPPGTAFLSGAEVFVARDGALRRSTAVVLWGRDGARAALGGKQHLVPGAEHLAGLERLGWVRSAAFAVAGYVPDLVAFERTGVFELERRGAAVEGARPAWRFGVSICFDNAFDDPYTAPLREGALDFHLVASNEAWYLESFEADQMIAFSRLSAIQTGRSFVRATNSGITLVLGPDGGEVARLERDGRDRMLPGTLAVTVPVPVDPAARTPYVRLERVWLALWLLLPALVWALGRAGARRVRT